MTTETYQRWGYTNYNRIQNNNNKEDNKTKQIVKR